jgi:hypothetical protein
LGFKNLGFQKLGFKKLDFKKLDWTSFGFAFLSQLTVLNVDTHPPLAPGKTCLPEGGTLCPIVRRLGHSLGFMLCNRKQNRATQPDGIRMPIGMRNAYRRPGFARNFAGAHARKMSNCARANLQRNASTISVSRYTMSMSMSGIQSTMQNQPSVNSPYQLQLQQLGQALQSGNLSAAQSDFATIQQAFTQTANPSSSANTTASNPMVQAFNQLGSDLQSGNLSAAQKDLSTVQQDLKSNGGPAFNHLGHYQRSGGSGGNSSQQNSLLQDLNQTGQSLNSTSLASAQQAYTTLQQQLQEVALGGAALSSLTPVSFDA